jgi:hypothetical protein
MNRRTPSTQIKYMKEHRQVIASADKRCWSEVLLGCDVCADVLGIPMNDYLLLVLVLL